MKTAIQYRLRSNVDLYETDRGCVLVSTVDRKMLALGRDGAAVINQLKTDWLTEDDAVEQAEDLSRAYFTLIKTRKAGMLDAKVLRGTKVLLTLSPSPEDRALKGTIETGATYILNQYAFLRREEDGLRIESPLTPCRIDVHDGKLVGMLHRLCTGLRFDSVGEDSRLLLSVLVALNMAEPGQERDKSDPMDFWPFHDLLFYSRTLVGRHVYPLGGTYPFHGKRPSLSPIRAPISDDIIDLPEPSGTLAECLSLSFSEVLKSRTSKREFSSAPLSLEELGAFLHTAARVKGVHTDPQHDDKATLRPSPSGGARHPLEIYPIIRRCEGVDPGAYRYDPFHHRMEKVPADQDGLETLLEENPYEFLCRETPQVTFNISARIGRTAWKYESIAYKIINQDLGCLYQTFYLVATALDLAPCALGSVDTESLGWVLGINWREEPFIGAFTLGK